MTIKIEEATRVQVALFLPNALKKAFSSYEEFMTQAVDNTKPKSFSEHHTACKVALAHVQLLLKLGALAQENGENDPELKKTMDMAYEELKKSEDMDFTDIGDEE